MKSTSWHFAPIAKLSKALLNTICQMHLFLAVSHWRQWLWMWAVKWRKGKELLPWQQMAMRWNSRRLNMVRMKLPILFVSSCRICVYLCKCVFIVDYYHIQCYPKCASTVYSWMAGPVVQACHSTLCYGFVLIEMLNFSGAMPDECIGVWRIQQLAFCLDMLSCMELYSCTIQVHT